MERHIFDLWCYVLKYIRINNEKKEKKRHWIENRALNWWVRVRRRRFYTGVKWISCSVFFPRIATQLYFESRPNQPEGDTAKSRHQRRERQTNLVCTRYRFFFFFVHSLLRPSVRKAAKNVSHRFPPKTDGGCVV